MMQRALPSVGRMVLGLRPCVIAARACSSGQRVEAKLSTRQSPEEGIVVISPHTGIDVVQKTITEYLWQRVGEWPDRRAVTCTVSGISYSYKELRELCGRFACSLLSDERLGLQRGDVVGLMLHNSADYPVVFHGAIEAGMVVSATNPSFTVGEIYRQMTAANAKVLVTSDEYLANAVEVQKNTPSCKQIIVVQSPNSNISVKGFIPYSDLISRPAQFKNLETSEPINLRSTVVLPFSSGTEGLPKGVMISHKCLVSSMCMVEHPDVLARHSDDPSYQDVVLGVLPLYHIFGMNGIMNVCLHMGRHNVFVPKFEPASFISAIRKYKPTILYLVPPLLLYLAKHPGITKEDMASFKQIVSGAATASPPIIEAFLERAGRDDIDFREGYGLTETAGVATLLPTNARHKIGSCGLLVPFTEARVIDSSGKGQKSHQQGELLIRGPQIMEGYVNNEEATRKTVDSDGWLHTGDVAYYDDNGYFYIVDRIKELIKVKGSQVSPTELEAVLRLCPGVADVAVVGKPDDRSGELPAAFVVKSQEHESLSERDIHDWMEDKVATFKRLSGGVRFVDSIPKSPSGKVLRRELVKMLH
ncbi:4-coumarate--CoA ligase-like [Ischnura elegans]|uniref:4-coumarate--CoA ligase-like n=1 Tax=Ischnura elegans TaxID=197161 RepID=UPI001ED8B1DC|nr:4-coumarate--CoA ligase-like [Ischnura elegans]